jgi:hypothetical protein
MPCVADCADSELSGGSQVPGRVAHGRRTRSENLGRGDRRPRGERRGAFPAELRARQILRPTARQRF